MSVSVREIQSSLFNMDTTGAQLSVRTMKIEIICFLVSLAQIIKRCPYSGGVCKYKF